MVIVTEHSHPEHDALTDVGTVRERARHNIQNGAVTDGYKADRDAVISLLNRALATELVCNLRYRYHHFMASGIHAQVLAGEFLEHAEQEREHADRIAARIVQLGGKPDFSPARLTERSHAEYVEGANIVQMIEEDLVAERIAVDTYREMAAYFGQDDPTSRRLMEEILAVEEEHAEELSTLFRDLGEKGEPSRRSLRAATL